MVLRHVIREKKICVICAVMSVIIWLCGCSGNGVETMTDSVSGDTVSAEEISADLSGNDAAFGSGMPGEGAASVAAVSGNAIPGDDEEAADETTVRTQDGSSPGDDTQSSGMVTDNRPEPVKVKGIYVSGPVAGTVKMDDLIDLVDQTELNALVIDIKNDEGKVTYKMQSEQVIELEAGVRYIPDIKELVTKCKEKDIYLIARIVAFRDPYLAEKKPEWAVHTKNGEVFRDKKGLAWVNPYQREVWDYLSEIASQAAADGFDEVQFDYIRFSTDIGEEDVYYGPEADKVDKVGIITEFTEYMYDQLAAKGVYVAADVFGTVIDNETDQKIVGQDYTKMAARLDYICPMVYPSHYNNGAYGIAVPDAEPYATIYAASTSSVQELATVPEAKRAHVRMWLQSFTAGWVSGHISYGPKQIREQMKGAYDAGYEEWILWNAGVNYQPDALLTEEEAEQERLQWEEEKAAAARRQREEERGGEEPERQKTTGTEQIQPEEADDESLPMATEITETKTTLQNEGKP